jgi:hypothetical protein
MTGPLNRKSEGQIFGFRQSTRQRPGHAGCCAGYGDAKGIHRAIFPERLTAKLEQTARYVAQCATKPGTVNER